MYRLLGPDEWDRIREPLKKCFGDDKEPPAPILGTQCAIEEDDDGNINGFLFLQIALHMEPFGSLSHTSFGKLKEVLDETLTELPDIVYYLHTASPDGIEAFTSHGFTVEGVLLEGKP